MEDSYEKFKGPTCVCPYYIDTGMFKGVKSRFDFLLPLLDENKVAYKIIKAVRKNRALLKMPRFTYTMPLLRLLPTSALDAVGSFLGINNSMDDFEGRKDK